MNVEILIGFAGLFLTIVGLWLINRFDERRARREFCQEMDKRFREAREHFDMRFDETFR